MAHKSKVLRLRAWRDGHDAQTRTAATAWWLPVRVRGVSEGPLQSDCTPRVKKKKGGGDAQLDQMSKNGAKTKLQFNVSKLSKQRAHTCRSMTSLAGQTAILRTVMLQPGGKPSSPAPRVAHAHPEIY